MRAYSILIVGALAVGGYFYTSYTSGPEDKVVQVRTGDPEMAAARAKAVKTLPEFWAKRAKPGPGETNFALKLALEDGGQVEHFWCGDVVGDQAKASCAIANEPASVKTVKLGQRIDVETRKISDWMYQSNGKIKGGQSIRVLLATLPKEEADAYRAMLAEE